MKIREILDKLDQINTNPICEDTQEMAGVRLYATPKGGFAVKTPSGQPATPSDCHVSISFSKTGRAYITHGMVITSDGKKYTVTENGLAELTSKPKEIQPENKPQIEKKPADPMAAANAKFSRNARDTQNIGQEGLHKARQMGWVQ